MVKQSLTERVKCYECLIKKVDELKFDDIDHSLLLPEHNSALMADIEQLSFYLRMTRKSFENMIDIDKAAINCL